LRQVLGNLIRNAVAATRAGGRITVTVRAGLTTASVAVADTGSGIAAEDLPHLFDRFWRADSARGRASGGSGLGLAIARQIVTNHGGTISATSRPGHGTVFTITLPRSGGRSPSAAWVGGRAEPLGRDGGQAAQLGLGAVPPDMDH
jgi:two-component system sensor histidine kinase BaeS